VIDILQAYGADVSVLAEGWRDKAVEGAVMGPVSGAGSRQGYDSGGDDTGADGWHPLAGDAEASAAEGAGVAMLVRARAQRRKRENEVVDNMKRSFYRVPRGLIRRVLREMARAGGSIEMVAQVISVIESRRGPNKSKAADMSTMRDSDGHRIVGLQLASEREGERREAPPDASAAPADPEPQHISAVVR